ncbi:MAG: glutathione S-transferase family protein [Pseudomonadota bacterium]
MYILYGGKFTRTPLVQWVLEGGGIDYELRMIDIINGEHRSNAFLSVNPFGLVPVLITPEGKTLTEVAALLLYLAERHGLSEMVPSLTSPDRGPFLSAYFHIATEIQAETKRVHFPHRYCLRQADEHGIQDQAKSLIFTRLRVLDAKLAKRGPYLLGERFSLADFYLCFWIAFLNRKAVCLQFPVIATLYDLVRSRPSAAAYLDDTERQADTYDELIKKRPGGVIA